MWPRVSLLLPLDSYRHWKRKSAIRKRPSCYLVADVQPIGMDLSQACPIFEANMLRSLCSEWWNEVAEKCDVLFNGLDPGCEVRIGLSCRL